MGAQLTIEHRLHERADGEAVGGGDQVDRAAHHDDAHHLAIDQQPFQRRRVETDEARPQGDVGVARLLRLEADEMVDSVERGHVVALEQQLTGERRPAEGAVGERDTAHRQIMAVLCAPMSNTAASDRTHRIAVIGGDGIGPEVIAEALKVLAAAGARLDTVEYELGGKRYLRDGEILSDSTLDELRTFDAILLGAVGTPEVPPGVIERGMLLKLRFALDLYINQRPFVGAAARVRRHP